MMHGRIAKSGNTGTQFLIVSKADLIASKRAAGRPIDLDDVRLLEEPLA